MIGLKKEIEKRKDIMTLKKYNEMVSVANVAKILNIYYNKAKRKIDNGSFTVREALDVFEAIPFKAKDEFEAFKYLFTEQGD